MVIFALLGAVSISTPTIQVEGAISLTTPTIQAEGMQKVSHGVDVSSLSSSTITFQQFDIWLFNAVFALLASTRFRLIPP